MNELLVVAVMTFCMAWCSYLSYRQAKTIEEEYEKAAEQYEKLRLLMEQVIEKKGEPNG